MHQIAGLPYREQVKRAYDDEIGGEAWFTHLARFHSGGARHALLLMADIEAATASALRPLLARHGITPGAETELRAAGREEAEQWRDRPWHDLVQHMATTYPRYVTEFEDLEALAPAADRPAMRTLVAHEAALVRFAEREIDRDPDAVSELERFLETAA